MTRSFSFKILAVVVVVFASSMIAQAQVIRWVSSNGTDAGTCPRTAPCATFQFAVTSLLSTTTGGQVNVVDPGQYGPIVIAFSAANQVITLDAGGSANGSVFAGISVGAGNPAIRVTNAGANNVLVVRGLTMDGQNQAGSDGIDYTGSGRLHVENVAASNFSGSGVLFQGGAGSPQLFIRDSSFRNNGNSGVRVASTAAANAFIENVKADGNNAGLAVVNAGSRVTARNFTAAGATSVSNLGVIVSFGGAEVNLSLSVVSNNVQGLTVSGAAILRLGENDITNNQFSCVNGGGTFQTYADNHIVNGPTFLCTAGGTMVVIPHN